MKKLILLFLVGILTSCACKSSSEAEFEKLIPPIVVLKKNGATKAALFKDSKGNLFRVTDFSSEKWKNIVTKHAAGDTIKNPEQYYYHKELESTEKEEEEWINR